MKEGRRRKNDEGSMVKEGRRRKKGREEDEGRKEETCSESELLKVLRTCVPSDGRVTKEP